MKKFHAVLGFSLALHLLALFVFFYTFTPSPPFYSDLEIEIIPFSPEQNATSKEGSPTSHPDLVEGALAISYPLISKNVVKKQITYPKPLHAKKERKKTKSKLSRAISPAKQTSQCLTAIARAKNMPPRYPSLSQKKGEEGEVLLRVRVSPEGVARSVEVVASSGHEKLDGAAVAAVSGWNFVSSSRKDSTLEVPVKFELTNKRCL